MIALDALSCTHEPALHDLTLSIAPGTLPAVVGPDAPERFALVELLAGFRSETSGSFLLDGTALVPRARQRAVVVLPQAPALAEDLTIGDHVKLVAKLRNVRVDAGALAGILAFAQVEKANLRPRDLDPSSALRLTLAVAILGKPALVVALDPPPAVLALLGELREPDRALLAVVPSLEAGNGLFTAVYPLASGRLSGGLGGVEQKASTRRYRLMVAPGPTTPQAVLANQPGIEVKRILMGERSLSNEYQLTVDHEVPMAQVIRTLVQRGVIVESLTEGPVLRGRQGAES